MNCCLLQSKGLGKICPLTDEQQKRLDTFGTDPQFFKQIFMGLTWDIERLTRYTNILMWHDFVFYHICGDMEFVTSDNPVMFINSNTANAQPFANGLVRETTLIYYPLSPNYYFALYTQMLFSSSFRIKMGACVILMPPKKRALLLQ